MHLHARRARPLTRKKGPTPKGRPQAYLHGAGLDGRIVGIFDATICFECRQPAITAYAVTHSTIVSWSGVHHTDLDDHVVAFPNNRRLLRTESLEGDYSRVGFGVWPLVVEILRGSRSNLDGESPLVGGSDLPNPLVRSIFCQQGLVVIDENRLAISAYSRLTGFV